MRRVLAAATPGQKFRIAAVAAGVLSATYLAWIVVAVGGPRVTLAVDDLGQMAAAWAAALICAMAAQRSMAARATWGLLAISCFLWGAGEAAWSWYALVQNTPVPFPSMADDGFLTAVPFACAALLVYPSGSRRTTDRIRGVLDGCIIAVAILFASWATILGPIYRSHKDSLLGQVIVLAYPMSDVVMVSLVIILMARTCSRGRESLGLVMAGLVAFAAADSGFAYLTEVGRYTGGNFLDVGWVAGYLLIGLGALWAIWHPPVVVDRDDESTVSLVAPYVPVLVVLVATSVQLIRGRHIGIVSWVMAFGLALLVLGREALQLAGRAKEVRQMPSATAVDADELASGSEEDPVLMGRAP